MLFTNEDGKTAKVSFENPNEPVVTGAVSATMDVIVASNAFLTPSGAIVAEKAARVVKTQC
ncbi:DUF2922 domain-containing protein [Bacillus sp. JJ1533]|uniref:DUF2922 domain-containing protein n=1 Tax=Bacillus sp. JJ1533 TaxID=3122959 RepID=UPI002FFF0A2C